MPKLRPSHVSVHCDQLLYLDLSWTDLEDLFLGYRKPKPRQYKSSGWPVDVNSFDEEEFRRMFRLEKQRLDLLKGEPKVPDVIRSSQGVKVPGQEALLMGLRRLAYPSRWWDVEPMFGRHSSSMSRVVSILFNHVQATFGHLLEDRNSHEWLTVDDLPELAEVSTCLLTLLYSVVFRTREVMKYRNPGSIRHDTFLNKGAKNLFLFHIPANCIPVHCIVLVVVCAWCISRTL
ncbi:hypothetical protein HPB48_002437 [Haemaphysalis longicornis]|uniref:Uncharacterized protein n=1 Tax=Haemaphysalis longicornis TaxID=44386 RepID=A0A9J6F6N7_HAELO|nr:hypothetical protein HPB48_002437 [Haemaphysalis longicornis]